MRKTFLSSAIANELIKKGKDVLYVSSNALFPILEDMHFGRQVDESAQYIVKKISDTELLILDDLGSEFVTQFTCAELFRIINTRLNADKKMIISTNLNRNMLQNTYNERIASRITGGFSMLEFLGDDIRRIKKLEGKMRTIIKTRRLVERVNDALMVLKMKPRNGEIMYRIIYEAYLDEESRTWEELVERMHMSRSTYYRLRVEAIKTISTRLWGSADPELDDWLEILMLLEDL